MNKSSLETPAFAGLDDYAEYQATEFGRCLANCVRRLRRYPARGITCYRLYDKDFPEVLLPSTSSKANGYTLPNMNVRR